MTPAENRENISVCCQIKMLGKNMNFFFKRTARVKGLDVIFLQDTKGKNKDEQQQITPKLRRAPQNK